MLQGILSITLSINNKFLPTQDHIKAKVALTITERKNIYGRFECCRENLYLAPQANQRTTVSSRLARISATTTSCVIVLLTSACLDGQGSHQLVSLQDLLQQISHSREQA